MPPVHFEERGGVRVDVRVPQPRRLDDRPHELALRPQLALHQPDRPPLGQAPESLAGDVTLAPKAEVPLVRGPYHVREVGEPQREGEVPGVGVVRPDSLEYHLRICVSVWCKKTWYNWRYYAVFGLVARAAFLRVERDVGFVEFAERLGEEGLVGVPVLLILQHHGSGKRGV